MFIVPHPPQTSELRRSGIYFAPSELEFKEKVVGYKHLVPNGTKTRSKTQCRQESQTLLQRLIKRRRIIQQDPLNHRQRQAAILDQVVVKLAHAEVVAPETQ